MNTLVVCQSCEKVNRVALDEAREKRPVCGSCRAELSLQGGVSDVTGAGLAKLLRASDRPVVVDFWAPWCGPCKGFAPVYQQAAEALAGQAVLVKLDTEASPFAGQAYQVRGIPTLVVFRNGVEVARQSGAMPLPMLLGFLKPWLGEARQSA